MMRTKLNKFVACSLALAFMGIVTGCTKEDIYDPESGTMKLPPVEDYFDFKLTGSVQLSVNYAVPGLSTVIEVYDQDPMLDQKTKKKGINPIYVAYTKDGKYEGKMTIPTAVTEAYVYTKSIAAPQCVKLENTGNGYAYDITKMTEVKTRVNVVGTMTMGIVDKNTSIFPYEVSADRYGAVKRNDNMYSITAWNGMGWESVNPNYYTMPQTLGAANEPFGDVTSRLNKHLETQRAIDGNKSLLRNPEDINIKVPSTVTGGMSVNITYVGERASFYNTLGYYYYKDEGKTLTPKEFFNIKKYILIPNVETDQFGTGVRPGETVKLLYFDEEGKQSDKFPPNYVIGWFIIANGFGNYPPSSNIGGYSNNGEVKTLPAEAYTSATAYSAGRYSCMSDDKGNDRRFVSLYDEKSKMRVIGIEDFVQNHINGSPYTPDDYMDVMFVAQTTPDLGSGNLPPIEDPDPKPEPAVWSKSGTAAFEDIWPYGGDYDLNDVIVEYNREITFDKDNIVTSIKETFKPVQKDGSAAQDNFFACQYTTPGKLTLPADVIFESATNSIVLQASSKTTAGKSFVIQRDMSGLGITQEDAAKDFNPYIITKKYTTANRVEVHLPMYEMTSAADKTLMNADNAYYIAKDKIYPFAIDIPISGYIPADETKKIDSEGQYPSFTKWATSKGSENTDWYLRDKGKKQTN